MGCEMVTLLMSFLSKLGTKHTVHTLRCHVCMQNALNGVMALVDAAIFNLTVKESGICCLQVRYMLLLNPFVTH